MAGEVAVVPEEIVTQTTEKPQVKLSDGKKPLGRREQALAAKIPPKVRDSDPQTVDPDAILKSLVADENIAPDESISLSSTEK